MVITRATEYAIRTIIYLAKHPKGEIVLKKDICRTQDVTPAFLTKILQPLIKAGIVSSQRGVGGGFLLNKGAEAITLLDILEAEEGPLSLNHCLTEKGLCQREVLCSAHRVWSEAQQSMVDVLQRHNVAELIRQEQEQR
ncbi:MAG TPA: Rrf2 family transcriptional regulator [Geopsychrobacteraceae bacterium]